MFSTLYDTYFSFQVNFKISSAICLGLDQSKILSSGNGLMHKVSFQVSLCYPRSLAWVRKSLTRIEVFCYWSIFCKFEDLHDKGPFYFRIKSNVNPFPNKPQFLLGCSTSLLKTLWEKGEIARNEQFLLFPQCFLAVRRTF